MSPTPPPKSEDYPDFVPFTARMMAAMRAKESARDDALFHDPFAEQLAGAEAFQQVEQRLTERDQGYVAVRTHFFDQCLMASSVTQVVILASGLDTRGFRLSWPSGVKLYEIDYPQVLGFKSEQLKDVVPRCEHFMIAADLTQDWTDQLLAAESFSPQRPTAWLIEGLMMYLTPEQVHKLLETVTALSAPGSELGLDLVSEKSVEYGPYEGYFQSGWDWPEELLSKYGWSSTVFQIGDPEANFGRYPWALPPREVAGVERAFLIRAKQ